MKCIFVKENSDECQANAMKDGQFCFLHNPDIPDEEKRLVQARGGRGNAVKIEDGLPEIKINTADDVVKLLEDTANRVRSGELDIRIANTLAYIAGHLLKALEVADVGKRLERFERVIYERK